MSATSWFIAGLLTGVSAVLAGFVLRRTLKQAVTGNRNVLFACGLAALGCAAAATAISVSLGLHGNLVVTHTESNSHRATAAQEPASSAMTLGPELPSASTMAEMLSVGKKMGVKTAEPMDEAAARLAARLNAKGGTAADWNLLAQAYNFLGRTHDAELARARAAQLTAVQFTTNRQKN